jgi:alpha,alpha-trehalase
MYGHDTDPSVCAGPITLPYAELPEPTWGDTLAGEHPPLRGSYPTVAIEPLSIAPNPGDLGTLYSDARAAYEDGMSLALAVPRRPYSGIVTHYMEQHDDPDFDPVAFWDQNFMTPEPDAGLFEAPPGMGLETYLRTIRPQFIHPSEENDSFDIWLPYDRSVAGAGRFSKHSFLWDGYHMAKGYAADNRWDLVLNIVDNTEYEINRFGYALNGSASFFVTRSQLPYFSNEISMLADEYGDEALVRYLPAMEHEYKDYWMQGEAYLDGQPKDGQLYTHKTLVRVPLANGKFAYLNRFWDDANGPRLESYQEDVELGNIVTHGLTGEAREQRLLKLYKDIRAAAASGHDFSSRWFADGQTMATINTTDILPQDLNSLLARTEQMLARAHRASRNEDKAREYEQRFHRRVAAINEYLWDPNDQIYRDYNYAKRQQTDIVSATMAYPLYVGIANATQSFGVARALEKDLLFPGGIIATTTDNSDQQWDGGTRDGKGNKNVWAPLNWAAARGLARMAHMMTDARANIDVAPLLALSEQVRDRYMSAVQTVFNATGTVPEKINGDDPTQMGSGGEYKTVRNLAMTGETWAAFKRWDPNDPNGCLPIGAIALSYAS